MNNSSNQPQPETKTEAKLLNLSRKIGTTVAVAVDLKMDDIRVIGAWNANAVADKYTKKSSL